MCTSWKALDWKDTDNIAFQREDGTMKKNKLRALLTPEELTGLPHPDRSTFPFEKTLKRDFPWGFPWKDLFHYSVSPQERLKRKETRMSHITKRRLCI